MPNPQDRPAVSVVMAVHNGMPYVEEAVRSMMNQTLREIEIIIIDDASTDETPQVLARLAGEDPRIRILTNEINLKLAASLNRGLEMARAPLIARMDADDISMPHRLEAQKNYMDTHPEVILSGASIRTIDGAGKVIRTSIRSRDAVGVRWLARFNMPLVHPTFMFRSSSTGTALRYDPSLSVAQDYAFCVAALEHGEVSSIPNVLLNYRTHGISITNRNWRKQQQHAQEIALRLQKIDLPVSVIDALAPFRKAYYDLERTSPGNIFSGFRLMLANDLQTFPAHRAWLRRQTAQLAATALRRAGMSKGEILRAFLGVGRDFLPALGLRYLEVQRLLPRRLRSDQEWT
jgi:glycosyltransferase involved in cell wall biosynthesis